MRIACVWFPAWPLARPDAPPDRPVVVAEPEGRVVAVTPDATGVELGMSRRQAEALCPRAVVLVRDRGEEARRFEPVVEALEELIPRVEVAEPGLVFIPLGGAVRYYGSEEQVVEMLAGKLGAGGDEEWRMGRVVGGDEEWRMGIAGGPFSAYWAARMSEPGIPHVVEDDRSFLASLDVSTLVGDAPGTQELVSTFRWLGITTLGALVRLPREAIATRFGSPGLEVHRLAAGEDRMISPRRIPPELAVESVFEEPLEIMDQVAFAARALAARLMSGMRREGIAPHMVVVTVELSDGTVRERVWRSVDPFTEAALADRVWWQLRAWVEGGVGGVGSSRVEGRGVVRLSLDPSDLSGDGRQLALFDDGGEAGMASMTIHVETERALARAQALVGPDSVLQAAEQGGRMPAERVVWRRWGEQMGASERDPGSPWPGATPSPAPSLVPPDPPRLEVEWDEGIPVRVRLGSRWEPVLTWSGPWRLTGRWWAGEGAGNRYQLVTSAGAFLCLVRDGTTYLAGVYD